MDHLLLQKQLSKLALEARIESILLIITDHDERANKDLDPYVARLTHTH